MSNYTYQANRYKENVTQLDAILDKVEININLISTYMQENPKSLMVDVSEKLESANKDINNIKNKSYNIAESLIIKAKKLDEEEMNKQTSNSTNTTKVEDTMIINPITNIINNRLASALKSTNDFGVSINEKISSITKTSTSASTKASNNKFERIYMD